MYPIYPFLPLYAREHLWPESNRRHLSSAVGARSPETSYYTILYYIMLYIFYYIILNYAILYYIILYFSAPGWDPRLDLKLGSINDVRCEHAKLANPELWGSRMDKNRLLGSRACTGPQLDESAHTLLTLAHGLCSLPLVGHVGCRPAITNPEAGKGPELASAWG